MDNANICNPIIFGLIAGIITYLILYIDFNYENKKLNLYSNKCKCPKFKIKFKLPLIIGTIVWASSNYFSSINNNNNVKITKLDITNLEQELFTDRPRF